MFFVIKGVFVNNAVAAIPVSGSFTFKSLRKSAAIRAIVLSYGTEMKFSSKNCFTSFSSLSVHPENDRSSVSTIVKR